MNEATYRLRRMDSRYSDREPLVQQEEQPHHGNAFKWEKLKKYFYNPDVTPTEIMGRDQFSWKNISLFYLAFYCGLIALTGLLMALFALILDEITPMRTGKHNILGLEPGLAMRPVADFESNLIRFIQGKPSTYKPFTDHLATFLNEYENEAQDGENFIDCKLGRPPDSENKVCRFNVDDLGDECIRQKDFGYDEGRPCILLKLNKIFGWMPEIWDTYEETPGVVPPERWANDHIGVTCDGRYDEDNENIGRIRYWPQHGLSGHFYPFINQEGYRSPLAMVQFENPINGVVIHVKCEAWAKNIRRHKGDRIGMITFELLID